MKRISFISVLLLWVINLNAQSIGDLVRFGNPVFSGITTAQASGPLKNVGAGSHLIVVIFPTAVATVSPIQVRLEASYDQVIWFPVSPDITSVPLIGNLVYSMQKVNGTWPAVRINSLTNTPGGLPMNVYYTGAPFPIGQIINFGDRWLQSGPVAGYDKVTFVICSGSPCTVGNDLTNHYIAVSSLTFRTCVAEAKTAPTGANLVIDIKNIDQGIASVFNAGNSNKLNIVAGSTTVNTQSSFALPGIRINDRLRVDILQIGSIVAGQDVTVVCTLDF
jgi:hypothetical protein